MKALTLIFAAAVTLMAATSHAIEMKKLTCGRWAPKDVRLEPNNRTAYYPPNISTRGQGNSLSIPVDSQN